MKFKKTVASILSVIMTLSLVGCSKSSNNVEEIKVSDKSYEELVEEAKGSSVNFYGYGGDEVMNKWFDSYVVPQMKEQYDINVKRVGMDIDQIMNSLLSDKQANNLKGNMDVVWINGENFKNAKDSNLLLGAFSEKLPNYNEYVDTTSEDITTDFGTSVDNGFAKCIV